MNANRLLAPAHCRGSGGRPPGQHSNVRRMRKEARR